MQEKIEILDADLARDYKDKLRLIGYWAKILNYPMGWHYWLDFIWILNHLEQVNLPKGSWIMDAGAGNGVLQFILASKGYNIISLDFAERDIPTNGKRIFEIKEQEHHINNPEHPYRKFVKLKKQKSFLAKDEIIKSIIHPIRAAKNILKYIIYHFIPTHINLNMWKEVYKSKIKNNAYGRIIYMMGDFTNLAFLESESLDCIISVSALEHADHEDINKAVKEFNRILKKLSYMFLTVSAAKDKDWYFQPCRGWCFCEESLKDIFMLKNYISNFNKYDELFLKLKNSDELKKRIRIYSRYYFGTANGGLPFGIYEPRYQPVGIIKKKT